MPKVVLRLRVPLGFLFAAFYLAAARPLSWRHLAYCAVAVVIGCALRSWAAGYLFKGRRVAVGGPYAFTRNPLYIGSFILGIGFCAVLWRRPPAPAALGLWTAYLLAYGLIYPAKTRAEEGELAASLGEDYKYYAARVPRFFPRLWPAPGLGRQRFSGELYRRNREYQCLLGCACVLAYLAVRYAYGF